MTVLDLTVCTCIVLSWHNFYFFLLLLFLLPNQHGTSWIYFVSPWIGCFSVNASDNVSPGLFGLVISELLFWRDSFTLGYSVFYAVYAIQRLMEWWIESKLSDCVFLLIFFFFPSVTSQFAKLNKCQKWRICLLFNFSSCPVCRILLFYFYFWAASQLLHCFALAWQQLLIMWNIQHSRTVNRKEKVSAAKNAKTVQGKLSCQS